MQSTEISQRREESPHHHRKSQVFEDSFVTNQQSALIFPPTSPSLPVRLSSAYYQNTMVKRNNSTFGAAVVGLTLLAGSFLHVEQISAFTSPHSKATRQSKHSRHNVLFSPEDSKTEETDTIQIQGAGVGKAALKAKLSDKIGKVDENRIIFPEIDSGEVSRMFSALEYSRSEQEGTRAAHASGSVLSATSLVAGTMVGAGILALPTATAAVGFLPSTVAMGVAWFYMTMSGLLIAELCLNRLGQTGRPGQGLLVLFQDSLGPKWSKVGSSAYFFLHYAVLVAYIAQGGVNIDGVLSAVGLGELASVHGIGQVTFASVVGLALYSSTPAMVEKFNNVLVLALAASFVGIIGYGAQTADFGSLIDLSNQHPEQVANAFPIIFLSLVYQNVVPTVVNKLEGDRSKITTAIISGTSIPTIMFLAWNAVILGNVAGADLSNVDPVAMLQSAAGGGELLGTLVTAFSSLALITSLIGFTYGLRDALTDVLKLPQEGPAFDKWKAPIFGAIFIPPMALSVADPDVFYKALELGGAFGVSTLFLVLPPIMVWGQRYGEEQTPLVTKPMGKSIDPIMCNICDASFDPFLTFSFLLFFAVPFGKIALGSMWKAAGTLILEQGAEKLGVFEWVSNVLHLA
jgi:tyrosine-specific transport protein